MVEYLNNIIPHIVDGFHSELDKIGYLDNAVFGKKMADSSSKDHLYSIILF